MWLFCGEYAIEWMKDQGKYISEEQKRMYYFTVDIIEELVLESDNIINNEPNPRHAKEMVKRLMAYMNEYQIYLS